MPENPNKLSQFWQELKRRNVVRVISVYAAAAFVTLELVSIIVDPLRLPDWTLSFVIVLLCIGFIIAVIFSWMYDIKPEKDLDKKKPVQEDRPEEKPVVSNSWRIASLISFAVIVALIVLNIIPRSGKKEVLEKSIAILPFINDSPNQERMYFINGTMEAILDNLSKIENIRVVSRTSVEQYRNNPKPIPVVAEEMDVSYVLEGSGHRDGDDIRLFIQLLDGRKDQHLWSNTYHGNMEDIFAMLSEIAQQVAGEIEAIITPEERALIEKKPTENQTAFDLWMRAWQFDDPSEREELMRMSLDFDTTFAWPYIELGWIYFHKYQTPSDKQPAYIDSVRKFINRALLYDDQSAGAYCMRGFYYRMVDDDDNALEDYNKALELSPNYASAYHGKAWIAHDKGDHLGTIQNFHRAASVDRGPSLSDTYRLISFSFFNVGYKEVSDLYSRKALELDGDSAQYYFEKARNEFWISHDFNSALELLEEGYIIDETNIEILVLLGLYHEYKEQYDKSLAYYEKYISQFGGLEKTPHYWKNHIGRSYKLNGNSDAADTIFNQQINFLKYISKLQETRNKYSLFLAQVYALIGNQDKVYQYLIAYNRLERMTIYNSKENIELEGFFNELFNEAEFQLILKDFDAKYQAEHERVRQWLEENDML